MLYRILVAWLHRRIGAFDDGKRFVQYLQGGRISLQLFFGNRLIMLQIGLKKNLPGQRKVIFHLKIKGQPNMIEQKADNEKAAYSRDNMQKQFGRDELPQRIGSVFIQFVQFYSPTP